MTHDELARRRPVWSAMSDLFLDTEVRWFTPRVGLTCAESGYDDETLERIFWAEVFPEAIPNMLTIAGEWGMLELSESALVHRANHPSIPWLTRRAHGDMVTDEWLGARHFTRLFRGVDPAERTPVFKALDALVREYFDPPTQRDLPAAELRALERLWWPRIEPLCAGMCNVGGWSPEQGRASVEAALARE